MRFSCFFFTPKSDLNCVPSFFDMDCSCLRYKLRTVDGSRRLQHLFPANVCLCENQE